MWEVRVEDMGRNGKVEWCDDARMGKWRELGSWLAQLPPMILGRV